jgi:hypothetical protein
VDEPRELIDAWPAEATLRIVKGDPFAFLVQLRDDDGDVVDTELWEWAGTVASDRLRLDFETAPGPDGCRLFLRGEATARLSALRPGRFDVACRQPAAGEGVMVLRGTVLVQARVTDPLRSDPDTGPREGELVPA